MMRRIAVNRVVADNKEYIQCIITFVNDEVIDFHTFTEEQPNTEWLGGTIELNRIGNRWIIKEWKY